MSKVLVINSGSSSLKFQLFDDNTDEVLAKGNVEKIGLNDSFINFNSTSFNIVRDLVISNHEDAINNLIDILIESKIILNITEITKIGHRVVQGGEYFKKASLIEEEELQKIKDYSELAPLHNPANAKGIEIFKKKIPAAKNIAVFDTEFHQTLPKESFMYAVPLEWYKTYKIRRYGMHGISHKYITEKVAEIKNEKIENINLIICHLGNGASITAVKNGKSFQTSMGLTPLQGLVMGARSGDIDPAIYEYLNTKLGYSFAEITRILNNESGVKGLSGVSSDFRDVFKAISEGNEDAKTAIEIYITRLTEYIGSYYFRLQGVNKIIFTAGIGEHNSYIRKKIAENLSFLGVDLDEEANNNNELCITTPKSKIEIMVIPTNEEYQIFKETKKFND